MKYTIITSGSMFKLIQFVNDMIELGWKPQGGVFICYQSTSYYQSMIKETE